MNRISLKILTNDSCGCCVRYKEKIEELQNTLDFDVEWLDINSVDLDETYWDFTGLPFTVVYVDGLYYHKFQGDMSIERIRKEIEAVE